MGLASAERTTRGPRASAFVETPTTKLMEEIVCACQSLVSRCTTMIKCRKRAIDAQRVASAILGDVTSARIVLFAQSV